VKYPQTKLPSNKKVMNASATTTLFIGDLSTICDEIKLYDLFIRFGILESVQLKKSDRDPQRAHLGFGFIKFASHDSAERALQELNGYFFLGRAMRVGWAVDYGKQQSPTSMEKSTDLKKGQTAQIHVMFVTRELNRRVSELDLGAVFSRYGNLVDIAIKKNAISSVRILFQIFFKLSSLLFL
jgi:polyadenylate-binding protein